MLPVHLLLTGSLLAARPALDVVTRTRASSRSTLAPMLPLRSTLAPKLLASDGQPFHVLTDEAALSECFRECAGSAVVLVVEEGCSKGEAIVEEFDKRCRSGNGPLNCATLPGFEVHRALCFSVTSRTRHIADSLGAARTPFVIVYDRGERVFDCVAESKGALFFGLQEAAALIDAHEEPQSR